VYRFIPKSRMGKLALILIAIWALKQLFFASRLGSVFPKLGMVLDFLTICLAIPATYYIWKIFKKIRSRLLWKIRRRLILANIFIGAIPVFMMISIFYVSALLFYYQFNYYLISNQIGIHAAQIHAFNLSLREGMHELLRETSSVNKEKLRGVLDADAKYLLGVYPSASIILRFSDGIKDNNVVYVGQNIRPENLDQYKIPEWLGDNEFSGLIVEDMQPQIYKKRLFLRSFVSSDLIPGFPFSLEISVPLDGYLLGRLKAALGQNLLLAQQSGFTSRKIVFQSAGTISEDTVASTFESEKDNTTAGPLWSMLLFPTSWTSGLDSTSDVADVLYVELSTSGLIHNVFRSESNVGRIILSVLQIIVGFFLIVEISSILIGIMLTKSITNAVHNLDRGTQFVKKGDFNHRIIVKSNDQLGALAKSFNQMTEYVQHLVKERVQKEKLERELEIAREVQDQLFPDHAPRMNRMDLAGTCLPARVVSGDYYDFLPLGAHELGLALGDICGKGISAALLMSNLQATLRSNVMNLWKQDRENGDKPVAEIVRRLNAQIYSLTSANKFATFFYAVYEEDQQLLTYCNAGHNPPLYFDGNIVRRLSTGGTVVGVFPDMQYDQETIQLNAGGLFFAYTDGIVECTNEYGEEFGEERLIDLIQKNRHLDADELKKIVVEQVLSWTSTEEQDDDMTLIVAKFL
jgi:sigma-B regulation protein RsbU (phosphoserine phosphatase)